jgi:hypothetical protein
VEVERQGSLHIGSSTGRTVCAHFFPPLFSPTGQVAGGGEKYLIEKSKTNVGKTSAVTSVIWQTADATVTADATTL